MKKTEIKINTDYAVSHSADYRDSSRFTAQRVTVLGPAETRFKHGRSQSVVPVRYADTGGSGEVSTRDIREEWAPYAEHLVQQKIYRDEAAQRKRAALRNRLRIARALVADLRKAGMPLETHAIFNDHQAQSLANFGQIVIVEEHEFGGDRNRLVAPLASSIAHYVFDGAKIEVPADVLIGLLNGNA